MQRLRRIARRFRPKAPARPTSGQMAVRDRYQDVWMHLTSERPLLVDGGANNGSTTALFLKRFPDAQIHAFEPNPAMVEQYRSRFGDLPNVQLHPVALGARDEPIQFNILQYANSSSILQPTALNQQAHAPGLMTIDEQITVPMQRLDSLFSAEQSIDLLKLDLQGYELEALKGCEGCLQQVKAISTEVEFVPLYEGQPLFSEIALYLRDHGFYLFNLYDLWTQPDGQLTAGDAVFLNQRYAEPSGKR